MKVLVTGASGFLGSHIVDACIEKAYEPRVIVRPSSDQSYLKSLGNKIEILSGNFTDEGFLNTALKDIDCVIHSAARVQEAGHRDLFVEANITITDLLLKVAKKNSVPRFVFVSSPSAVAELKDQVNIDESYPFPEHFLNYYCETKALAEQHVLAANCEGFTTCAIRPRAVWGPRDTSGPFAKFLKKLQQEKLKDFSGGRTIISSICYVRNAADACLKAAVSEEIAGKTYFVTDNETIDIWKFADQMAETFGIPKVSGSAPLWLLAIIVNLVELIWTLPYLKHNIAPPISRYSAGLITHSATYNIDAARKDLGYTADISLSQAIDEYKAWVQSIGGVDKYLAGVS